MSIVRWVLFAFAGLNVAAGAWKFFEIGHWGFGSGLVMALIALVIYRVTGPSYEDEDSN